MEVCPDAGVIIQELSQRIVLTGGAALIADYGHDGTKTDTFRVRTPPHCDFSEGGGCDLFSCHLLGSRPTQDLYFCFLQCAALLYYIIL